MKVTVTRFGGLAAGIRKPPQIVDSSGLAESTAAELKGLLESARNKPAIPEARPGSARDAMTYRIVVEGEAHPLVLSQSDTTMSPEFSALLAWVDRHARGT